jgi:predicted enzyme related to lactoylglutathione lyase
MPAITSYPPGRPAWVDLLSADPDEARRFYAELFGWTFEIGPPQAGGYTMCLVGGEPVAGIGQSTSSPDGFPAPPAAWTTYRADDAVETAVHDVERHGGTVLIAPLDVLDESRIAVAADPTNAVFGLWEAKLHVGSRIVREPGTPCWHECLTPDSEAAVAFYVSLFGYEPERLSGFDYTALRIGGEVVCGVYGDSPTDAPPTWATFFAVEDADKAAHRAMTLGGSVVREPFESTYGRVAEVRDPEGAAFTVLQLRPDTT